MDLARLWRRYPEPDIRSALDEATRFVTDTGILDYWAEEKPRQFAIVVWADALYHLCLLDDSPDYRRHLADAMLRIEDAGLGYPPSLLRTRGGGDPRVVAHRHRWRLGGQSVRGPGKGVHRGQSVDGRIELAGGISAMTLPGQSAGAGAPGSRRTLCVWAEGRGERHRSLQA
jgi:hypothetical protein